MNQMEHNVKIKDYKHEHKPSPFVECSKNLNYTPIFPNNLEQEKMLERFQQIHWQTDKIAELRTHDDKMFTLRQEQDILSDNENRERLNVQDHRLQHLQGIKDNIQESRDRFFRRTQLERPGTIEKQLGTGPLYKIINDGKPIKF